MTSHYAAVRAAHSSALDAARDARSEARVADARVSDALYAYTSAVEEAREAHACASALNAIVNAAYDAHVYAIIDRDAANEAQQ
jgi:hypothetical protein